MALAADYNLGPNTFPRGWFVIAESSELDVSPLAIHFFGEILHYTEDKVASQCFWMPTARTWEPTSPRVKVR